MKQKILRLKAVRDATGYSRSSIYLGMKNETFPKSIQLGTRMVGWSSEDIEDWIEQKLNEAKQGANR
ncbi:MAG: AlpA family phage regulatory protein [Arenicella sp.]|nr:AlpA family phage regulatory protein [Arenicella sp.]